MPRTSQSHRLSQSQLRRLHHLPQRKGFVLEGGRRTVPVVVQMESGPMEPGVCLWIDVRTDTIRNVAVINPEATPANQDDQAIASLVHACLGPFEATGQTPAGDEHAERGPVEHALLPAQSQPQPELPEVIRLNDPALLGRARDIFTPVKVRVELVADLESFEKAFASLVDYFGAHEEELPAFGEDVESATAQRVVEAAAALHRAGVWDLLPSLPPVEVALGELGPADGVNSVFPVTRSQEDGDLYNGVDVYFSLDDAGRDELGQAADLVNELDQVLEMLKQPGMIPPGLVPPDMTPEDLSAALGEVLGDEEVVQEEVAEAQVAAEEAGAANQHTPFDAITLVYEETEQVLPSMRRWFSEHGVQVPDSTHAPSFLRLTHEGEARPLNAREARAVAATCEALTRLLEAHREELEVLELELPEEPLSEVAEVQTESSVVPVTATYPAPGFNLAALARDWLVDLPPATEAGKKTIYRFKVVLQEYPDVWRRIELTGEHTLEDLHFAIQDTFAWDDDHLHAFYLSGKPWDPSTEYGGAHTESERYDYSYHLESLPLKKRQRIMYIFDFGDEWRHEITLEAIEPNGVNPDTKYPAITESHGDPVPQYPYAWGDEVEVVEEGDEVEDEDGADGADQ